jgi:hypothetical protein
MRNPTGINRVREQSVDVSARKRFPAALGAIRRCAALRDGTPDLDPSRIYYLGQSLIYAD